MALELGPILRSMRHHKGAFALLVLEVAFGFVILAHTYVSARYYYRMHRFETGLPVQDLVVVTRRFLRPIDIGAARAQQRIDLAVMDKVPGLRAVAALDGPPLPDSAAFPAVLHDDRQGAPIKLAWFIRSTPKVVGALGLDLLAGRGLDGAEPARGASTPLILTRTLAADLFGAGPPAAALGKTVLGGGWKRGTVVGVVADFCFRGAWVPNNSAAVIGLAEPASEHAVVYVARVAPGKQAGITEAIERALGSHSGITPDTIVQARPIDIGGVRYMRLSHGAVIVLSWTGLLVVAVALAGSLALASFSVAERTRQIGVRRALGARRDEIIGYFLLENVILTSLGLALGIVLAMGLNLAIRRLMADLVLTADAIFISMFIFLVTGLLSALVPARRAAAIPPWAATRTL